MTNKKTKKICLDCGGAPINHFFAKVSARANHLRMLRLAPIERLRKIFLERLAPHTDLFALFFIKFAVYTGIGKLLDKPDYKTCGRAAFLWEKAPARGIKMQEFRLFNRAVDTYIARKGSDYYLFEGLPRPHGKPSPALDWMDSKSRVREEFIPAGIPMAAGGEVRTLEEARAIFRSLPKPNIAKPHIGSRSRHTTIHINTETELAIAYKKARQLSPWVIIERELKGLQYRGTVIDGKTVAVLRRDPACVFGDGRSTVRELVEGENKNPKRQGPIFHTIPDNESAEAELRNQDLTWQSIPKKGRGIMLGAKASRSVGGGTTDVTRETHTDNIALFDRVGQFLHDPIVGVDFIISDISKSWRGQDACGVIECNSLPFIDLHKDPLVGETQDAASPIWDSVFPKS